MYKIICFFLFILTVGSYGQLNKTDSLLTLLKTERSDTTKLKLLNEISDQYEIDRKDSICLIYAQKAIKLSDSLIKNNFNKTIKLVAKKEKAYAFTTIGIYFEKEERYLEAINSYKTTLKIYKEINYIKNICTSYLRIGILYMEQGNYPEALKCFLSSLKLSELSGNKKIMAKSYGRIGMLYSEQNNITSALDNYFKCLNAYKSINDNEGIAYAYNNIGVEYKKMNQLQNALKYHKDALKIFEILKDENGIAKSYNNIGAIFSDQKKHSEALKYCLYSLEIKERLNDKKTLPYSYINIAGINNDLKKHVTAKKYLEKALIISKEIKSKYLIQEVYSALAKVDSCIGNHKSEIENYKLYIRYRDSLNNEEAYKKTIQTQLTHDFEKRQEIAKIEHKNELIIQAKVAGEKNKKQKLITYLVATGLFLVILFSGFIFKSLRVVKNQKSIIEHQKSEVEVKNKEITDSINYAKRIQYTLLAHADFLKENIPYNFVYFNPKDIVSGDFYWATKHDDKFYLAVCDSTGHGVPGAFMSLLNIGFLSEAISEKGIEKPNDVFDYVRMKLTNTISKEGQKDGFDGILVCFDQKTNSITYAAANNAPILIQQGNLTELDANRMPVGVGERKENFTLYTIDAKPGDVLYLYTDGYADQFGGPKGKKFKYKQLNELLLAIHSKTVTEQHSELKHAFENWRGDLEQVDDVCLIGIKI